MARKRTNGTQSHAARFGHSAAPLEKLIGWLAPDGRRETIVALFDNRTTWHTIRDWRRGRRHVPQWAIDLLSERAAMIADAASQLEPGPGSQAGRRNLIPGAAHYATR